MASSSVLRSGIKNYARYLNVLSGTTPYVAPPEGSFDLLTSTVLSNASSSVSFSSLSTYSSSYRHFQIRGSVLSPTDGADINILFNGDSSSNYKVHLFYGDGSSVTTNGGIGADYNAGYIGYLTPANTVSSFITDIFDPFVTTKYKSVISLQGSNLIMRNSTLWMNTAAVSSINVTNRNGNFSIGSRISLYGLRSS